MGFSAKQVQALRRQPNRSHIRTREAHGRELTYLEGWYAISEANRIFGFDGWSRETIESKCVLARENRGTFLAVYTARVRVTVHADGATVIREGHGTGEGRGHVTGRSARHRPQDRGNRCHQTGVGDLRQTLRSRALSRRQDGMHLRSPCPRRLWYLFRARSPDAGRRPAGWLSSGRYDPYSATVPLLWPPPGSGHPGSGAGSPRTGSPAISR